ncbi:MAG: DNA polymerase III subunit beta [Omnitrophica bacterium GWA2_52_8]|nr:MAG: DNA polymerase III subunit beta [Omnitrophica bacterium GWA2_52_8]
MEIIVHKGALVKALSSVGNVASQKANTLPILSNVLFETTKEEGLRLVGTDLEVGVSTTIPITITKPGSITIPAKKLSEIIRELPDGEVEISVKKNNAVNIKSDKAYFKIMGLSVDDYPKLPEFNLEDAVELDQAVLKEGLSLTAFAISYDETRYVLNGVLLSVKGNKLRLVATDGRRLAFVEKDFKNKKEKNFEIIIPSKAVQELIRILSWEGEVKIIPTKNQVVFYLGDSFICSRIIEGNFPNYEQVIPKESKITTSTDREELLQAVKRTALLTSPDSPAIKIDFVKGKILISSRSPNLGEAHEEIDAEIDGEDIAIGFNPYYIIDVLKNLDVEKVSLSLTEPDKPGLLKGKEGYLYVIMPMQIS